MKIILTILLTLLTVVPAMALDKKIGTTNCFKIGIFDTEGNGIAGLDVVAPFADFAVKLQCGAQALVTMDETTDTVADEGGGYYYVCTNDVIGNANEEECLGWVDGEGNYVGLIAKSPVKFKAVGATVDVLVNIETDTQDIQGRLPTALVSGRIDSSVGAMATNVIGSAQISADAITSSELASSAAKEIKDFAAKCDISAATSGTSFTIATCVDEDGTAITPLTDWFVGSYMVAYTNGAAQCNVVNHGVFVGDVTSGGIVTVKDSDLTGSGFPATPNTTNCGIRISP